MQGHNLLSLNVIRSAGLSGRKRIRYVPSQGGRVILSEIESPNVRVR